MKTLIKTTIAVVCLLSANNLFAQEGPVKGAKRIEVAPPQGAKKASVKERPRPKAEPAPAKKTQTAKKAVNG